MAGLFYSGAVFAQDNSESEPPRPISLPDSLENAEDTPVTTDEFTPFDQGFIPVAEDIEVGEDELNPDDTGNLADIPTESAISTKEMHEDAEIKLPNPVYEIKQIDISGNTQTSRDRILSMMHLAPGSLVTLDELEECRFQLVISGAFQSVEMSLIPSQNAHELIIRMKVAEHPRLQINNYWLGTSEKSPFWMGLDVTWLAPFSLPHRLRMALGATSTNDYTLNLTYFIPSISRYSLSLFGNIHSTVGHEGLFGNLFIPDHRANDLLSNHPHLGNLNYRDHGVTIGMGYAPAENFRLLFRASYAHIHKDTTDTRLDKPSQDFLASADSHHPTLSALAAYDNRSGADLPKDGHFIAGSIRGTFRTAISDYQYIRATVSHQSNFEVAPGHILRLNSYLGLIYGDAPFFERFFYHDYYTFTPARFQNLNPSDKGSLDLFNTGASSLSYEDFIAHLGLTYAWHPWHDNLEVFVTAAATYADSFDDAPIAIGIQPIRDRGRFPVDMSFNAGVRIRTPYGLIHVSLAQIINLIPRSK